jgi:hypothetical protein
MATASRVSSEMVEFHRFGRSESILSTDSQYIRTAGWDDAATVVTSTTDQRELTRSLNLLRARAWKPSEVEAARNDLMDRNRRIVGDPA